MGTFFRWARRSGFDLALHDPSLCCMLRFLFCAATSYALAGAGSPEVNDRGSLTLPDHPFCCAFCYFLRAFRFFLFCAATSHGLAVSSSPEVNDGCFGINCGTMDGVGDGMFSGLGQSYGMFCMVVGKVAQVFPHKSPYTKCYT